MLFRSEEAICKRMDTAHWQQNPIRFLVIDFKLVASIDMSSSEALIRIWKLMKEREVTIVLCGYMVHSSVERSLRSAELLDVGHVETFPTFHKALECECLFLFFSLLLFVPNLDAYFAFLRDRKHLPLRLAWTTQCRIQCSRKFTQYVIQLFVWDIFLQTKVHIQGAAACTIEACACRYFYLHCSRSRLTSFT